MHIIEQLRNKAQALEATIVFPEAEDQRTLHAVAYLAKEQIVKPVLVGDMVKIHEAASEAGINLAASVQIIDPATYIT